LGVILYDRKYYLAQNLGQSYHLFSGGKQLKGRFKPIYRDSKSKMVVDSSTRKPNQVIVPYEAMHSEAVEILPFTLELSRGKLPDEVIGELGEREIELQ
jgi:hypothetical protein